jgi:hypothetical protein
MKVFLEVKVGVGGSKIFLLESGAIFSIKAKSEASLFSIEFGFGAILQQ